MAPAALKKLQLMRTAFIRHYDLRSEGGQQLYYVDISSLTPGKPDLTMHQGGDTKAPVVAACHMPRLSTGFKIALGDPLNSDSVQWEDMTREGVGASEYRWQMTLPDPQGGDAARRARFVWKRTQSVGVEGQSVNRMSRRNYKLVDEDSGDVVAVFTSDRSLKKCGDLQVDVEYGTEFEVMAAMTSVSLYERGRRRRSRGLAAGGAGGS